MLAPAAAAVNPPITLGSSLRPHPVAAGHVLQREPGSPVSHYPAALYAVDEGFEFYQREVWTADEGFEFYQREAWAADEGFEFYQREVRAAD